MSAVGLAKRALPLAVLTLLLFGAVAAFQQWRGHQRSEQARAAAEQELDRFRPGDCLTIQPGRTQAETGKPVLADCSAAQLTLTVGLKVLGGQDCPGQHYFAYRVTLGPQQFGALCLVENLREGQCYAESAAGPLHEEVPCSTTEQEAESVNDARVVRAVEGSDDPSVCVDSSPVAYPEPKRVYCLGSPVS